MSANFLMLTTRSELILRCIVEDYIRSAEPVGSRLLAEEYGLGVSPATIRNEMMLLEQDGYIRQPHTSAGRIPTEKGYQYYLRHIVAQESEEHEAPPMKRLAVQETEIEGTLKSLAQRLVELSGETAFVAFDPRWSYYAGISNLFHKPDFEDLEQVRALSLLMDSFDQVVMSMSQRATERPAVFIGSEGLFGNHVSTIVVRYVFPNEQQGTVGLIGPLRMNYIHNLALVQRAYEMLDEMYER